MTIVVDSSAVVAALVDSGVVGQWAERQLTSQPLAAPELMPAEAANILRRAELANDATPDVAAMAHQDLLEIPATLFPYEPFAARAWALRSSVTAFDAWYVALAEALEAPLVTLDRKLARAPGPTCSFRTPPV